MLKLKQLQVQLRFLPLLRGAVELGRFVLDQPEISLEVDKTGRPNWVFAPTAPVPTPATPAAPTATAPESSSISGALSNLRLEDVRLVDGKISYRDDRTGSSQEVDGINVKVTLLGLDTPLSVEGSATWHDQKLATTIGLHKPSALLAGQESGFDIKLDGEPLTVSLAGSMTGLPPTKLGGTIDLSIPSIRGLAKWAGAALPPGGGLEKLSIKGKIDMQGPKIAFTDAAIMIDAITAQGSLAVDTSGARPYLKGTLAVDKLDVNPYLPPPAPTSAAGKATAETSASGIAAAPAQTGWSDAPIDLSALGMADADFDLKTGSILYRKIAVGPSGVDIHLKDKKLILTLGQLALYQGQGQGKVTVDGSGATPSVALDFSLAGLQVEPLLVAAAGTDRLSGTGKVTLDVTGSGKSQRALINDLNGKGALDLTNGQLKGVNLIALAENATSALTGINGDNRTDFGSLTGTFTIVNGIAHNDDLQLKSGVIPITGKGTVNLPNRTVDYRVTVSLAGAIGVPVLVSGPWDNLSYKPDLAGALEGAVQKPGAVLNQLRSLGTSGAGAAGSGAGAAVDKLKSLFGK